MIEGLKVSNKWGPISGSPIVNVSRVEGPVEMKVECKGCNIDARLIDIVNNLKSDHLSRITNQKYRIGYSKFHCNKVTFLKCQ